MIFFSCCPLLISLISIITKITPPIKTINMPQAIYNVSAMRETSNVKIIPVSGKGGASVLPTYLF